MLLSDLDDNSTTFIDANIFIYHFSRKSKFNPDCTNFLERVEKKKITGVTSIPVVQEVLHRMMIAEASTILPDIKAGSIVKYLKDYPDTVKKLLNHHCIPEYIASFNLEIISPEIKTIERSQQMKMHHGFLSNDALTLQIMEESNVNNLASNDSDFGCVDFITLYKPL